MKDFIEKNCIQILMVILLILLLINNIKLKETFEASKVLDVPADAFIESNNILKNKPLLESKSAIEQSIRLVPGEKSKDADQEIVPPESVRAQNYKEPIDMSESELKVFKSKFRIDYTIKDYSNWLNTYISDDKVSLLPDVHKINSKVIQRGGALNPGDIPSEYVLPDSYVKLNEFHDIYKNKNILLPGPFSTDNGVTSKGSGYLSPNDIGKHKISDIKVKQDFMKPDPLDTLRFVGPTLTQSVESKHFIQDSGLSSDGAAVSSI